MVEPKGWTSPARTRLIEQGVLPPDIDEIEEREISEAVARILGKKPADQEVAEPESLTKAEARRADRKAAIHRERFGRG